MFSIMLGPHVDDVSYAQVDDLRCSRSRLSCLRPHAQGSVLADSLGKPHDYVSIAQRRLYRVAEGRASLVIGQRDPICSVNDPFIEALFEFEEQLREQSIAVDNDLPFLPY